jgi:hypothetical protein
MSQNQFFSYGLEIMMFGFATTGGDGTDPLHLLQVWLVLV